MNFKKFKITSILIICIAALIGFKSVDNHFEISKNLEIFSSVYKEVNTHYVDELKPGELMRTGVNAMLGSLDPYTNFYSEAQAEEALMRHEGEYGGIGVNVGKDGEYIVITNVAKDEPAAKADLRIGDKFLTINGASVTGIDLDGISTHLKGGVGSQLDMEIERPGVGKVSKKVIRGKITVANVPYYGMVNKEVGYIKLNQFMSDASAEVIKAFNELKKNPELKGLILDLRNNGGGYLHEAVNIVNIFVPQEQLIVTTRGRRSEMFHEYYTRMTPIDTEIPLTVLINQRSASASEIVSGGLQDLDRAVIIGVNSFGKGLVQNTMPTKYRTQVKITTAKYYTPSGRCIQLKDYSARKKDGSAGVIADSLRTSFKTKNGREVKDGGGVLPDIVIENENQSEFVKQLIRKKLFFEYANIYRNTKEEIPSAKDFSLTDKELGGFLEHIKSKGFVYESKTLEVLKKLKSSSKEEKILSAVASEVNALEKKLSMNVQNLFNNNKQEVKEEMEKEIASRYFYDDALFEASFEKDKDIIKSIQVIGSLELQNTLLNK